MQDGCEPLLAIADSLAYGDEARDALVKLLTSDRVDSTERTQVKLLRDIRTTMLSRDLTAMHTSELLASLHLMNGWSEHFGRPLADRDLIALLAPYGIHSKSVHSSTHQTSAKGYHRNQFADAWRRYVPVEEPEPEAVAV
jgi:hypothetical protein